MCSLLFFFFKQKTAYEMRISDWSSDVCSSDLSSVAVFIDGVYRSRSGIGLNELGELERIEVLRGPQGTLFGRNASAGLINIVSKKPNQIGRASWRERVCQYVYISVVAVSLKKKKKNKV